MKKRLIAVIVFILCICGVTPVTAYAFLQKTGSLTFVMKYDGVPLKNTTLSIIRVADAEDDQGKAVYSLTDVFRDSGINLSELSEEQNARLSQKLHTYASKQQIVWNSAVTGEDGKVSFSQLDAGLYLVTQGSGNASGYVMADFLVPIPVWDENGSEWNYVVTAYPKTEPAATPNPTETPTPTVRPTPTPTPTVRPTPTSTSSSTPAPTVSPTPTPSSTPTVNPTEDPTPEPSPPPSTEPGEELEGDLREELTEELDEKLDEETEEDPIEALDAEQEEASDPDPGMVGGSDTEFAEEPNPSELSQTLFSSPQLGPPPTTNRLILNEDGSYLEIGEDDIPLGTWVFDEDEGIWIFEEYNPLGNADFTVTLDDDSPGGGLTLPQTGMLRWPIPVLAASGMSMFMFGLFLIRKEKKDDDED